MRIPHTRLSFLSAFFLFSVGIGPLSADQLNAVVLEAVGDRVVINRGTEDGVKTGQTWIFGPKGSSGGMVVEEVREHSASGRLRGNTEVGELASLGKSGDLSSFVSSAQAQNLLSEKSTASPKAVEALRRKYKKALSSHTESRGFVTPVGGGGGGIPAGQVMDLGMQAYNAYRLYDITNDFGLDPTGFYSPWWVAAAAVNVAGGQMARNKMYETQRVRVDTEVVYWDADLVDLQTEVMAAEQGLSVTDTLTQKVAMQAKRGTDKYTVFEVTLRNVGKLPAQMGEFKYHMFLISNEGRPISASRVDPVLDKTLAPGDEVRGMVYFPKIVAAGQQDLRVVFERMFGDRGELTFRAGH